MELGVMVGKDPEELEEVGAALTKGVQPWAQKQIVVEDNGDHTSAAWRIP